MELTLEVVEHRVLQEPQGQVERLELQEPQGQVELLELQEQVE